MAWQDTYYVTIGGGRYKAGLIERAKALAAKGPLTQAQAHALWESAQDGPGITATERRTLQYIVRTLALQPEARAFLDRKLRQEAVVAGHDGKSGGRGQKREPEEAAAVGGGGGGKSGGSKDRQRRPEEAGGHRQSLLASWLPPAAVGVWQRLFGGRACEEDLLQLAARQAQDGALQLRDVQALWRAVLDGHRVTERERRTLTCIADSFALDEDASAFLAHKLLSHGLPAGSGLVPAPPPSADAGGRAHKKRRTGPFTVEFFSPGNGGDGLATLLGTLASASRSLDLALYALTDDRLAGALVNRHEAGVKVRVLADKEADEAFETSDLRKLREAGVEVRLDRSKLIMHHKFAVVDGAVCVSGSLNWTTGALMHNWENIVVGRSASLADAFAAEFERLWSAFAPGAGGKPALAPAARWSGGIAALFFPDEGDANFRALLAEVRSAKSSLDVAVFALTVRELKDALKDARRRDVRVRVVTDDRQARLLGGGSHLEELLAAGLEVRMDGPGGSMHHKFCVIDGATVCNGSFNWTRQAEDGNNENLVIYRSDPGLARSFTTEFERMWAKFERA
mmetsp:Transcript_106667/g.332599  ORF Transcript_106667/g.332599 Transcript_106667/m.332599 type:complete len:569 (+) Transcript_106667:55-1761(+)